MSLSRVDPGLCPVCGAAHTACTASTGAITSVMLPSRDAGMTVVSDGLSLVIEIPERKPEAFSTATYRGAKKKP